MGSAATPNPYAPRDVTQGPFTQALATNPYYLTPQPQQYSGYEGKVGQIAGLATQFLGGLAQGHALNSMKIVNDKIQNISLLTNQANQIQQRTDLTDEAKSQAEGIIQRTIAQETQHAMDKNPLPDWQSKQSPMAHVMNFVKSGLEQMSGGPLPKKYEGPNPQDLMALHSITAPQPGDPSLKQTHIDAANTAINEYVKSHPVGSVPSNQALLDLNPHLQALARYSPEAHQNAIGTIQAAYPAIGTVAGAIAGAPGVDTIMGGPARPAPAPVSAAPTAAPAPSAATAPATPPAQAPATTNGQPTASAPVNPPSQASQAAPAAAGAPGSGPSPTPPAAAVSSSGQAAPVIPATPPGAPNPLPPPRVPEVGADVIARAESPRYGQPLGLTVQRNIRVRDADHPDQPERTVTVVADPRGIDQNLGGYWQMTKSGTFKNVTSEGNWVAAGAPSERKMETAYVKNADGTGDPRLVKVDRSLPSNPVYTTTGGKRINPDTIKEVPEPNSQADQYQTMIDAYRETHKLAPGQPLTATDIENARAEKRVREEDPGVKQLRELTIQAQKLQQPTTDWAQTMADAMLTHRIAPEQLTELIGGFGPMAGAAKRMVTTEAIKKDPNFNFEQASADFDFSKSPQFQNTVRLMDSATNSLSRVQQAANTLANGKVRSITGLLNAGKNQFNNVDLKKFQTDALLVGDEVGKIIQGGGTGSGVSDSKLKQAQGIFKDSDDPAAIAGAIGEVQNILGYRRQSLTRGTYMATPSTPPGTASGSQGGASATPPRTKPKTAADLHSAYPVGAK